MNPNGPQMPSADEFMAEIQHTQAELSAKREASWKKTEPAIEKMLTDANFPDAPIREVYKQILKVLWYRGYASGATDMAGYMARQLGAGPMVDMFELAMNQTKQKPENN